MTSSKYIGMDVHKESISIAVRNAVGKIVMECVIETKASTILQFFDGLRGELHVTFEEGTWAAWLFDLLKPHVTKLIVCEFRDGTLCSRMATRMIASMPAMEPQQVADNGFLQVKLGSEPSQFVLIARGYRGIEHRAALHAIPSPFADLWRLPHELHRTFRCTAPKRTWLSHLPYWWVRADPDILADCPLIDRFQIITKGVLLCVIAGIAVCAWGGFWSLFWPFYIAIPLTLLTVSWITLIDQAIGAAHWRLRGILASPSGGSRMRGVVFFLRLAIGIGTSYCTATSAIMLLSHQTIVAQEARDRDAANAAKRNAAAEEKHQLWKAILGDRDAEVRLANADVTTAATQLEAARTQRAAAGQQLLNQKIELDCQLKGGPKCDKGEGPLFRQAVARRDKAQGDLQLAETDINRFETRLTLAEHKRDDALAAFRQREPEYQAAAQAVDQRVERERVPESDDPILAYDGPAEGPELTGGGRDTCLCQLPLGAAAADRTLLHFGLRILRPCQHLRCAADRTHAHSRRRSRRSLPPIGRHAGHADDLPRHPTFFGASDMSDRHDLFGEITQALHPGYDRLSFQTKGRVASWLRRIHARPQPLRRRNCSISRPCRARSSSAGSASRIVAFLFVRTGLRDARTPRDIGAHALVRRRAARRMLVVGKHLRPLALDQFLSGPRLPDRHVCIVGH